VFTDTGTTADGQPLFQFTHRTFLEYFTADYLVASSGSVAALADVLRPHIARREWDVVAIVACQLKSRATQGAGDEILAPHHARPRVPFGCGRR